MMQLGAYRVIPDAIGQSIATNAIYSCSLLRRVFVYESDS